MIDLHTSLRTKRKTSDGEDPMSSVANLVDAMLVFACGLLLALISHWNVNVSPTAQEIEIGDKLTEVDNLEALEQNMNGGSGYIEMGTVYQDPVTGKSYILEKSDTVGASGAGDASGASGAGTGAAIGVNSGVDAGDGSGTGTNADTGGQSGN